MSTARSPAWLAEETVVYQVMYTVEFISRLNGHSHRSKTASHDQMCNPHRPPVP